MDELKCTPEDWVISEAPSGYPGTFVCTAKPVPGQTGNTLLGAVVADCESHQLSLAECQANARLVAAAKDQDAALLVAYKALNDAMPFLEHLATQCHPLADKQFNALLDAYNQAGVALRKARGKK